MNDPQPDTNVFSWATSHAGQFKHSYLVEIHVANVWSERSYADDSLTRVEGIVVWCSYPRFIDLGARYSALKETCFNSIAAAGREMGVPYRRQTIRTTFR